MVGGRSRLGVLLGCRLVESACARGGHRAARLPSRAGATMSPTEGGPSSKGEHSPETERLLKSRTQVRRSSARRGDKECAPATPYLSAYLITGLMVRPPPDPSSRHRTRDSLPSTTRVGRAPRVIVRALAATRPRHRRPSPPRAPTQIQTPRAPTTPSAATRTRRDRTLTSRHRPLTSNLPVRSARLHLRFDQTRGLRPRRERHPRGGVHPRVRPGLGRGDRGGRARTPRDVLRLLRRGRMRRHCRV